MNFFWVVRRARLLSVWEKLVFVFDKILTALKPMSSIYPLRSKPTNSRNPHKH